MEFNRLYCIDNIELMYKIKNSSIHLIYCDILYNTGLNFKFKDGTIAYSDKLGDITDVIDFYKPRFIEMKRILSNNGNFIIQCDYRISPYIQILLSETGFIFQDKIIWKKSETSKGAKAQKNLSKDYDEIFHFTKTNDYTFNMISKPHDTVSLKEYKYYDDVECKYFKIVPLGMYSKISIENMKKNNEIYTTSSGKEYKKYYLKDMNESNMSNIWLDCHNLYNGENKEMVDYPTQKPKSLLERIIYIFSNENDIVADFFLGSGTTCVVAKELGRNYIGCDINEKSIEIAQNRILTI